jgi:hypothetical protein
VKVHAISGLYGTAPIRGARRSAQGPRLISLTVSTGGGRAVDTPERRPTFAFIDRCAGRSYHPTTTLPTARSDEHRCFDLDGNGSIEPEPECLATLERVLPLPPEATRRADIPFKWILLNWNPQGHAPPHIYGRPHFDIHYVMEPIENIFAIMPGPCGEEFIRCDQFERAVVPVPEGYMHPDFQNVGAAVPAMGNHLVDLTGHEFHGSTFDRAWMYGAYEGRVTFWEEMVTREFLLTRPDTCFDIKTPAAVAVAGYYPTRSCFGFGDETGEQRVSVEGFVYRDASPPVAAGS